LPQHRFSLRVPLFEVDMGQAVYHGNYYHIFELGREAFLRDLGFGYPELVARQMHLAIVEAHCRYRQPVRYNEEIEVITTVTQVKSRGVKFEQQLVKKETGQVATEVVLATVCIHFGGKPAPLPEELRARLQEWQTRQQEALEPASPYG